MPEELRGRARRGAGKAVALQPLSCVQLFVTLWTAARQASLTFTVSQRLLRFTLCHPPLLLPSLFRSIRVFSSESALHIRWPKHWSFSINLSNEYSGLTGCSWVVGLWLFCLFTFQYFPISSNEHALF